jgi:putative peptidoglycan lipid II flippase
VAAGIFLSRISGLVRDRVFAHFFGTSLYADAWRAALRLPNVLQNLLGEGTLSASFIPIYAEYLEEGREEEAGRFAGAILGLLLVVVGALVLVGYFLAPLVVPLLFLRWTPEKQALTVQLVRILLLMTGVLVISAWALGILNSHRKFFISYVAPVLWNLAMIVALLVGGITWGLGQRDLVVVLAWGAVVGGLAQVGIQLPWVIRVLRGFRLSLNRRVEGVSEAIRNFTPVLAARGVVNLSGYVDLILAGLLTGGAVALLGYAQTLYLLPISLFGMSVAAAELPELSRNRRGALDVLTHKVDLALGRVGFWVLPSAAGYLFFGDVIVAGLYRTGEFGTAQVLATYAVLAAYSLGLMASSRSRVLSSAFYALHDTRTPARISYLRVALSAGVGAALMFPMDAFGPEEARFGAAGLALGASVGAWVEFWLLRRSLSRTLGTFPRPGRRGIYRLAAAAAATLVAGGFQVLLPEIHPVWEAGAVVGGFAVVYLALTRVWGVGPETPGQLPPSAPTDPEGSGSSAEAGGPGAPGGA